MNRPPPDHAAAACDDGLNFCLYESSGVSCPTAPPNIGNMGVVTLGPPDANGDRVFVSRRPFTEVELAGLWAEHNARHGLAA